MALTDARRRVDPELLALLDRLPAINLDAATLPQMRALTSGRAGEVVNPELVERTEILVPRGEDADPLLLIVYRPATKTAAALPCIYHMHGGGFVSGSAGRLEVQHRAIVAALDCVLVSVEYRLAPETRFPGPLEDCYAGISWLGAHAEDLGINADRIGVMGESAGGGLAAAVTLMARDRSEVRIAFQHLYYPMLDDRIGVSGLADPGAGEFVWTAQSNAFAWSSYLGTNPGSVDTPAYAAPARADDLSGLPPAFIMVGALDLFLAEDIAYAAGLLAAGVPTELHVFPGAYHGFDLDPNAAVSRQARDISLTCLRRCLHGAAA